MAQRHKRYAQLHDLDRTDLIADMASLRNTIHKVEFQLLPSSAAYKALQPLHDAILAGFDALGHEWRSVGLTGQAKGSPPADGGSSYRRPIRCA